MIYNENLIDPNSLDEELEVKFFMAVSKLLILCQKIENNMKFFVIRADFINGIDIKTINDKHYTMGDFSTPYLKYIKKKNEESTEVINWLQQQLSDYPSDQEFVFEIGDTVKTRKDIQDKIEKQRLLKKKYKEISNTVGITVDFRNKLSHELMKDYSFVISDPLYSISTILEFIERKTKWLHKQAKYVFKCEELISNLLIARNSKGEMPYRYPKKQKEKMKIWVFHDLDECIASYREEN